MVKAIRKWVPQIFGTSITRPWVNFWGDGMMGSVILRVWKGGTLSPSILRLVINPKPIDSTSGVGPPGGVGVPGAKAKGEISSTSQHLKIDVQKNHMGWWFFHVDSWLQKWFQEGLPTSHSLCSRYSDVLVRIVSETCWTDFETVGVSFFPSSVGRRPAYGGETSEEHSNLQPDQWVPPTTGDFNIPLATSVICYWDDTWLWLPKNQGGTWISSIPRTFQASFSIHFSIFAPVSSLIFPSFPVLGSHPLRSAPGELSLCLHHLLPWDPAQHGQQRDLSGLWWTASPWWRFGATYHGR